MFKFKKLIIGGKNMDQKIKNKSKPIQPQREEDDIGKCGDKMGYSVEKPFALPYKRIIK